MRKREGERASERNPEGGVGMNGDDVLSDWEVEEKRKGGERKGRADSAGPDLVRAGWGHPANGRAPPGLTQPIRAELMPRLVFHWLLVPWLDGDWLRMACSSSVR